MGLSTFDTFKHMTDAEGLIRIEGENLRLLQAILLEMLVDIDSVCAEIGVDYNLAGGNCLGALRHGGFIPWDDDADINMTREGYDRFVPVFLERFGDKYWVHDMYRKDGYELCFPRIRRKGTVLKNRDDFDEDQCGICIDVFLMENAPNNAILRKMHGVGSLALGLLYSCRRFAEHEGYFLSLVKDDSEATDTFKRKITLGKLLSFLPLKEWMRAWDNWNSICKKSTTDYVVCPVGRKHYFGELWRRNELYPARRVVYENTLLCIPRKAEEVMTSFYGDYLKVPPVENRETHVVYALDFGEADAYKDAEEEQS